MDDLIKVLNTIQDKMSLEEIQTWNSLVPEPDLNMKKKFVDDMVRKYKKCILTNDKFSCVLEVDVETILFSGISNIDYFKNLYTKLGYIVELRDVEAYEKSKKNG